MPDSIERKNPNQHTCGICGRKWIAQNPNRLNDNGKPVCTLCLTEMIAAYKEWVGEK